MLRSNNLSKSTKRRRLLEELNFIQHLTDSSNNILHDTNDSDELENPSSLTVSNNIPLELSNDLPMEVEHYTNEILCNTTVNKISDQIKLTTISNSNTSNLNLNVVSVDDNNDDAMIKQPFSTKLIQWATENNVPNNTFDSLLKVLNTHKCFNDIPISSKTFYKNHSGYLIINLLKLK